MSTDPFRTPVNSSIPVLISGRAPRHITTRFTDIYPIFPDVPFKALAFYDVLETLIRPTILVPSSAYGRQKITLPLHLSGRQIEEITRDLYRRIPNETSLQVQLRFCKFDSLCEQEDCFPPGIQVIINDQMVQLPLPISTNPPRPGVEIKRPSLPVNITQNIRLSIFHPNQIDIQWHTEFNRSFVVACYLVRKLSTSVLLRRLKIKGVKPHEETCRSIKDKFKEDSDIATTLLKVSLICPLGKMRMITACRASTCNHLQCFDATCYLSMNEKNPTWNCPICSKPAGYEQLVIDEYFQRVLEADNLTPDDNEIQLYEDGTWSVHKGKVDIVCLDTPIRPNKIVEIAINHDPDVIVIDTPSHRQNEMMQINEMMLTVRINETIVNLLSDSDEDDIPLLQTEAPRTVQSNELSGENSDEIIDIPLLQTKASRTVQPNGLGGENSDNIIGIPVLQIEVPGTVQPNSFSGENSDETIDIPLLQTKAPRNVQPNGLGGENSDNIIGIPVSHIEVPGTVQPNSFSGENFDETLYTLRTRRKTYRRL